MSAERPLIGIVGTEFRRETGNLWSGIGSTYLRAIEAAGGIPLLIHLSSDQTVLERLYALCDGIVFAGGGDVDPQHYGQEAHPKLGDIEALRDAVELHLARNAVQIGLPIFGICRGAQLLNVAMGGTLYQDIGAQLPDALEHRESALLNKRTHLAHPLRLRDDSWLAQQLDTTELAVNTIHHQALQTIAPGLRVTGYAPDGVVEAIEGTGPHFLAAVQCHPEELWHTADPRWARVFRGFVTEVERRRVRAH
jgi:putative glutamine amidotransferase